jgi:hypothetical protein
MAGLYALAAAFLASFSVVYVSVCIFIPFLGCGNPISISLAAFSTSSILYNILQLYHQLGSGGGNVAARVEGRERAAIGKEETCSGCSVSLTTRTGSSSTLRRSVSSRSLGGERGQGLCYVSTFYTTLVKKSQQANGASDLRRTPLLRTRVTKVRQRASNMPMK